MTKEELNYACDWIFGYVRSNDMGKVSAYDMEKDFRKDMEGIIGNKEEIPSKLTWQDVKEIVTIADNALGQFGSRSWLASEEAYYTEVLRRLNEKKED